MKLHVEVGSGAATKRVVPISSEREPCLARGGDSMDARDSLHCSLRWWWCDLDGDAHAVSGAL